MFLVIVMIFVSMKRRENNLSNYEKKRKKKDGTCLFNMKEISVIYIFIIPNLREL